jgi:hypothetical protein
LLTRGDLSHHQQTRLDNVSRIYPSDSHMKLTQKSGGKENTRDAVNFNKTTEGKSDGRMDTRYEMGGGNNRINDLLTEKDRQL